MQYKRFALLLLGLAVSLSASADVVFEEKFDSGYGSGVPAGQDIAVSGGSGVIFAQENLADFAALKPNLKPGTAITFPLPSFPSDFGSFEMKIAPYFNQLQPYRSSKQKFKLYYIARAETSNKESAFSLYIQNRTLNAELLFPGKKKIFLTASVADWKPGQWHTVRLEWTPTSKNLLIDGKPASESAVPGPLQTAAQLTLGGSGNDCSLQGALDDVRIESGKPAISETFSTSAGLKENWELVLADGAEGNAVIDESLRTPDGQPTLRLTKTNNRGYLMLRRRKAFGDELKPGTTYRIGGVFHAENAMPDNTLCFRVQRGERFPYYYDVAPNSGEVYTTYSLLNNNPRGTWEDNFYYFIPSAAQKSVPCRLAVLLRGSPCSVNLGSISVVAVPPHPPLSPDKKAFWAPHIKIEDPLLSEEEVLAKVAKRTPATLEIRQNGRTPQLLLNGRIVPPIAYRVQFSNRNARYLEMNRDAGIDLLVAPVTAGGKFRSILKGVGKYDFTEARTDLFRALCRAPDAVILLQICAYAYPGMEAEPDEIWQNRDGLLAVSSSGNMLYADRFVKEKSGKEEYYPSYASQKWRKTCTDAVVAYLEDLKASGLLNAIGGITLAIGEDGQMLTRWPAKQDFSPAARRGFAAFLRKKYGTEEKLRAAWNNPKAEFDFPSRESMPGYKYPDNSEFRNPANDQAYVDAMEYHYAMQKDTLDYFAKRCLAVFGRPVLAVTSSWGGLAPWQADIASGSGPINGTSPQLRYPDRRPGRPIAIAAPLDSQRCNGVIDFQELDLRTYVRNPLPTPLYRDYHSYAMTPDIFKAVSRRLAGFQIAKGMGFWYYDMAQEFADKPLLEIIRKGNEIYRRVAEKPDTFQPDTAVLYDNVSAFYWAPKGDLPGRFSKWQAHYSMPSGVPYDIYYLDDFLAHPERWNYKTVIVSAALRMTPERRAAFEKLKSADRTLVWLYPAGILEGVKQSSELMGIGIRRDGKELLEMEPASGSPLARNLEGCLGVSSYYGYACYLGGAEHFMALPRFVADDPAAEVIGKFLSDGKPGIALRKYPSWTSIFVASPDGLSAQLLWNIARRNGSFIAVDRMGLALSMRDRFMSLHAMKRGTYQVRFPQSGKIMDADSGKVLTPNGDTASVTMEAGETRWLIQE